MEDNTRNGREVSSAAASRRAYDAVLQAVQSGQIPADEHTMRALAILNRSAQELQRIEAEQKKLAESSGMAP
jgi:hypothetical protein